MQIHILVQWQSYIPSVGPNLQKRSYPSQRFKGHKRLVPFRSRNLKDLQCSNPNERRRRDFQKKRRVTMSSTL